MGYPGGKSGPGVYHRLINLMPPHQTYIEPFLGGGAVMRLKLPAAYNIGVDLSAAVIRDWRSRIGEAAGVGSPAASGSECENAVSSRNPTTTDRCGEASGATRSWAACSLGENGDGRSTSNLVGTANSPIRSRGPGTGKAFPPTSADACGSTDGVLADRRQPRAVIGPVADPRRRRSATPPTGDLDSSAAIPPIGDRRFRFLRGDALTFLASYPFAPNDLIYCDPPYLMETRSGGRLYQHEFSNEQHAELLATIGELPSRVMISGYWSQMYNQALKGWNRINFMAMTRGGMAEEWVWFNFPPPVALHDYRYLGETAHQRQDLKRQIASWTGKLERMSVLKKQALLSAIARVG